MKCINTRFILILELSPTHLIKFTNHGKSSKFRINIPNKPNKANNLNPQQVRAKFFSPGPVASHSDSPEIASQPMYNSSNTSQKLSSNIKKDLISQHLPQKAFKANKIQETSQIPDLHYRRNLRNV